MHLCLCPEEMRSLRFARQSDPFRAGVAGALARMHTHCTRHSAAQRPPLARALRVMIQQESVNPLKPIWSCGASSNVWTSDAATAAPGPDCPLMHSTRARMPPSSLPPAASAIFCAPPHLRAHGHARLALDPPPARALRVMIQQESVNPLKPIWSCGASSNVWTSDAATAAPGPDCPLMHSTRARMPPSSLPPAASAIFCDPPPLACTRPRTPRPRACQVHANGAPVRFGIVLAPGATSTTIASSKASQYLTESGMAPIRLRALADIYDWDEWGADDLVKEMEGIAQQNSGASGSGVKSRASSSGGVAAASEEVRIGRLLTKCFYFIKKKGGSGASMRCEREPEREPRLPPQLRRPTLLGVLNSPRAASLHVLRSCRALAPARTRSMAPF